MFLISGVMVLFPFMTTTRVTSGIVNINVSRDRVVLA